MNSKESRVFSLSSYEYSLASFSIEIGGEIQLGKIDSGKEIKAKAYLGISPDNPVKSYFYTNINKFSTGAIAEAFDYDLSLPKVLSDSGFHEGVIASFTMNPSGKYKQKHMRATFTK